MSSTKTKVELPVGWHRFTHSAVWTGDGYFVGDQFDVDLLSIVEVFPRERSRWGKKSEDYPNGQPRMTTFKTKHGTERFVYGCPHKIVQLIAKAQKARGVV